VDRASQPLFSTPTRSQHNILPLQAAPLMKSISLNPTPHLCVAGADEIFLALRRTLNLNAESAGQHGRHVLLTIKQIASASLIQIMLMKNVSHNYIMLLIILLSRHLQII